MSLTEIALGIVALVAAIFGGIQLNGRRRAEADNRKSLIDQAKQNEKRADQLSEKQRDEEKKKIDEHVKEEKKIDSVDFLNDVVKKKRGP